MKLQDAPFALLRAYARIAPTERGGFRLARAGRALVPRGRWKDVFQTGGGLRLELDLATYPDVAMAAGLYELATARLLRRLLRPGMHFVDGGANIGFLTCRAARLVGPLGRVDAFEPDPLNRQRLEDNLLRNQIPFVAAGTSSEVVAATGVCVRNLALSSRGEHLSFQRPVPGGKRNHGESGRFFSSDVGSELFSVQAARLDTSVDRVPDLVKLDLEGSELLALRGATQWLKSIRPPVWIIEHNPPAAHRAGYITGDLWREMLATRMYQCRVLGGSQLASPEDLDVYPRQGNLLFTPA